MKKIIYTIGYGGIHDLLLFVKALQQENINVILDVRSVPYSKYHTPYNKENLKSVLNGVGIAYLWKGDAIGGLQDGKKIDKGVERLIPILKNSKKNIAVMCAEKDPDKCHRGYQITPVLLRNGIEVVHLTIEA